MKKNVKQNQPIEQDEVSSRVGDGNANTRSAFISILGRPNVGKSSIINNILGQKVAIVSSKPQTTRTKIMGVSTKGDVQLVFIDTPGIHKPKTRLAKCMITNAHRSIAGVDIGLLTVEAGAPAGGLEINLVKKFKNIKAVLAINKIDKLKDKSRLAGQISEFSGLFNFEAIVPVSAKTGDGIDILVANLSKLASFGEHFFEPDTLTDQPERTLVAEIIREKLLHKLEKEVPHGIAVLVEKMKERSSELTDITATIYCERESHKGIIIGKSGIMLRKVGEAARFELEQFLTCKVNLQLWVKVKKDWRNKENLLKNFGLSNNNSP